MHGCRHTAHSGTTAGPDGTTRGSVRISIIEKKKRKEKDSNQHERARRLGSIREERISRVTSLIFPSRNQTRTRRRCDDSLVSSGSGDRSGEKKCLPSFSSASFSFSLKTPPAFSDVPTCFACAIAIAIVKRGNAHGLIDVRFRRRLALLLAREQRCTFRQSSRDSPRSAILLVYDAPVPWYSASSRRGAAIVDTSITRACDSRGYNCDSRAPAILAAAIAILATKSSHGSGRIRVRMRFARAARSFAFFHVYFCSFP